LKILGCTVNMTAFLSMALILKHYKYINLNMNGLSKTQFLSKNIFFKKYILF